MNELEACRKEIDEIDKELVDLFERRMKVAVRVAEYKKKNNLPIFNEAREKQVIEKNIGILKEKSYADLTRKFFNNLMELSRSLQENLLFKKSKELNNKVDIDSVKLGFQGVRGSFSEEALIKYFGICNNSKSYEEFEEVFEALKNEEIDYGILPIENSCTGAITRVYDLLAEYGFYIVGEECIKIDQHLMGIKGSTIENITEVYSHPQGFEQSREFLSHNHDLKLIPYHNTAISAKLISDLKDKSKAAIASKRAAEIYNLEILKEKINDKKDNHTKFIIIGRDLEVNKGCNKVTVVFSLEDKAGTLYELLRYFADNNINLIKIESRPNKHESWKYLLYVDFQGNIKDKEVKSSLELIEKNSGYFKVLGSYKKSKC